MTLGVSNFNSSHFPKIDIYQLKDDVVVQVSLPGCSSENIQVSNRNNLLALQGEIKEPQFNGDPEFHLRERGFGHFSRVVELPGKVDLEKPIIEFENGVMTLTFQKAERAMADASFFPSAKILFDSKPP